MLPQGHDGAAGDSPPIRNCPLGAVPGEASAGAGGTGEGGRGRRMGPTPPGLLHGGGDSGGSGGA